MLDLTTFDYEDHAVRVVDRDGAPWFVAADVCRILDIANPRDALTRLDNDEKDMINRNTVGLGDGNRGNPNMNIVSESGLYALIFTSVKPEAKAFRKWVTSEVLPALRRHGRYEMPDMDDPDPIGTSLSAIERQQWLSLIRETRLVWGAAAARRLWGDSPFPDMICNPDHIPQGDDIARVLQEHFEATGSPDDVISASVLVAKLSDWMAAKGVAPMPPGSIARRLAALAEHYHDPATGHGFRRHKRNGCRVYTGLRLRSSE
jgi:prophage antirepressor-like protein